MKQEIPPETVVKVVHISDLHISEQLITSTSNQIKAPHRYGHNYKALSALDAFLNNNPWDVLVISGDVSRIGSIDSFVWAQNWIQKKVNIGASTLGLDLATKPNRHYVIVPGNHDRFNGKFIQTSLDDYNNIFPVVRSGKKVPFTFGSITVNFHVFDSSDSNRSFAKGMIDTYDLTSRPISNDTLDIAVLHHHFIQPPEHERERATEITNSQEVASYMLAAGFNGVFFGHTHKSFVDYLPTGLITRMFPSKGQEATFWKSLMPRRIIERLSDNTTLGYQRESTKDGKYPTIESYFTYLYIRDVLGLDVSPPAKFRNVIGFYTHLEKFSAVNNLTEEIAKLKQRKILVSMAPSACQAEAKRNGFHVFDFIFANNILSKIQPFVYTLEDSQFKLAKQPLSPFVVQV